MIRYFKDYIEAIDEGLIKTHPGNIVSNNILKTLKLFNLNVECEIMGEKIKLTINNFNIIPLNQIENVFDQIHTTVINNGGWFPSRMELNKLSGLCKTNKYDFNEIIKIHDELKSISIYFEKKFESEVEDIPDKLYHLTIKEHSKKINKYGLVPKSKSKLTSHLDRIYICKTYQDCIDLIPRMMFYYTGEKDENIYKLGKKLFNKDITPIIYEINNTNNIIDRLYLDVNYDKGYYTLNNIPPSELKIKK